MMNMKLHGLFALLIILLLQNSAWAQKKTTLGQLLAQLGDSSSYKVIYSPSVVDTSQVMIMDETNPSIDEIAAELRLKYHLDIKVKGDKIIIFKDPRQRKYTLSGYLTDASNGEALIGASLYSPKHQFGQVSNHYGFYSITLPEGSQSLVISYVGYQTKTLTIDLTENKVMNLSLSPLINRIEAVIITADGEEDLRTVDRMGTHSLSAEDLEAAPILLGEADPIKSIQTLPGVKTAGEGSSSFFVRGSGLDQNLILLDEAPVYNPSHVLGFFSVFNPDAINKIEVFKGDIPASEGGRLASLVDVRMKDGNNQKLGITGGLSPISGRLTLEGPLKKDKASFLISGRQSVFGWLYSLYTDDANLWFYDLNGKLNWKASKKDKLFLSLYTGQDQFRINSSYAINWGNTTGTFRWNHLYSNKLFSTLSLIYSRYNYSIDIPVQNSDDIAWNSGVEDFNVKLGYSYYLSPLLTVKFGGNSILHEYQLGSSKNESISSWENALYSSLKYKTRNWKIEAGLRYSNAFVLGPFSHYELNNGFQIVDSTQYMQGEIVESYGGLEPRFSAAYQPSDKWKWLLSVNRTRQYLQLLSNATGGFTSFDLWYPITKNIAPQIADQFAIGVEHTSEKPFQFGIETYYKRLQNQLDYVDHAQIIENDQLELELRQGKGYAYGIELSSQYSWKKFHTQVSYTYSRTFRQIDEINSAEWYPTTFDRPHDIKVQCQLKEIGRFDFMTNWVFASGAAATLPIGFYNFDGRTIPVYSSRNGARLPNYHRLDLAIKLNSKADPSKRWKGEWILSVINAYNRHNAFSINFGRAITAEGDIVDPKFSHVRDNAVTQTYLFSVIPSLSYNFKF